MSEVIMFKAEPRVARGTGGARATQTAPRGSGYHPAMTAPPSRPRILITSAEDVTRSGRSSSAAMGKRDRSARRGLRRRSRDADVI